MQFVSPEDSQAGKCSIFPFLIFSNELFFVSKAYHVLCTPCAVNSRQCAKCLVSADEAEIIPPNKTAEEERKEQSELDKLLKNLPERKRRTFLRYLRQKDEKKEVNEDDDGGEVKKEQKVKSSELDSEIRRKFEELKLIHENMKEELGFLHDLEDSDEEDDDGEDFSDEEKEEEEDE